MQAQLHNGHFHLQYDGDASRFALLDEEGELLCETRPLPGRTEKIAQTPDTFSFAFITPENKAHITVRAEQDGQFSITLQGEGPMGEFCFPGPWIPRAGDRLIYPLGDGVMLPVDEPVPFLPSRLNFSNGSQLSMGLVGLLRGEGGLFIGMEETADAALSLATSPDGLVENQLVFLPAKGEWRYPRRIRLMAARADGFNALCKAYRAWRMAQGLVVPLPEKAKRAPRILDMAGRADIWIFDDQNMNRLYGRPEGPEETPRDVQRAADDMLALGMDRVLLSSFEGETPEDVAYLKARGFEVGRYDIYRDVIPKPNIPFMLPYRVKRSRHTESCWPQDVRRDAAGEHAVAWQLHGTDGQMHAQHAVCDMPALRMTMEDVPPLIEEAGYTAWFIDVSAGSQLQECYHPLHPMDRRDAMRYVKAQNQFLLDMGLICGVEVGCEAAAGTYVYSEGMMSPPYFRALEAGRNMNTLYYGPNVPEQITAYMLNPRLRVPLWQMIYHDCTINYWYWGDSSNCCPEWMPLRDLFNALYAVPPLYCVNMTQWEALKGDIAASYRHATETARAAAFLPMTRFEWLTPDGLVQRTTFEGGMQVTVNFGEEAFERIGPGGCLAMDKNGEIITAF